MNFDSLGGQYKIGYNLRCKSIISPFKKKKKRMRKRQQNYTLIFSIAYLSLHGRPRVGNIHNIMN